MICGIGVFLTQELSSSATDLFEHGMERANFTKRLNLPEGKCSKFGNGPEWLNLREREGDVYHFQGMHKKVVGQDPLPTVILGLNCTGLG